MAFINKTQEQVKAAAEQEGQGGGSKYINKSGMYPVTILAAFVDQNAHEARTVNFFVEFNGEQQVVYGGLRLDNNKIYTDDGSKVDINNVDESRPTENKENKIGMTTFLGLCTVTDTDPADIEEPETMELPIGKGKAGKDVEVLEIFEGLEVVMRVGYEYSIWNNQIKERQNIKGFYRADDCASAKEILDETEAGVRYEKDLPYADKPFYKESRKGAGDAPTEAEVLAWKDSFKKGGNKAAPSKAPTKAKRSFGKK